MNHYKITYKWDDEREPKFEHIWAENEEKARRGIKHALGLAEEDYELVEVLSTVKVEGDKTI